MWTECDRAVWGGTGWRRSGQCCISIEPPVSVTPKYIFLSPTRFTPFHWPTEYSIELMLGAFSSRVKVAGSWSCPFPCIAEVGMRGTLLPHPIHYFNVVILNVLKLSLLGPRNSYLKCRGPSEEEQYRKWKCQVSRPEHNTPWLSPCLNCQICLKAFTVD